MIRTGQIIHLVFFVACMFSGLITFGQTANLSIDIEEQGDEVLAHISIQTDEPIVSAQFSLLWDSTHFPFQKLLQQIVVGQILQLNSYITRSMQILE